MRDEMARVKQLNVVGGKDAPYFISCTPLSDAESINVGSNLGAVVNLTKSAYQFARH